MRRLILAVLIAVAATLSVTAQDTKPNNTPDTEAVEKGDKTPAWKSKAAELELADNVIAQLERDGLAITDKSWRQSFKPYNERDIPPFITSDVVLNAFHVLYQESICGLELANAAALRKTTQILFDSLAKERASIKALPELFDKAENRVRLVLAVALELFGTELKLEEAERELVNVELARIKKAEGNFKPEWLGKPDPGFLAIDYSQFKPRGFYTNNERLSRYFKAVRWLQMIPFRVDFDVELASAILLGHASWDRGRRHNHNALTRYEKLLGQADNLPIKDAMYYDNDLENDLSKTRKEIREKFKNRLARINDRVANPPAEGNPPVELSFRIVAAYRMTDTALFQTTTDPRNFERSFPTGLEVAAMLGSSFARGKLESDVAAEGDKAGAGLGTKNLYDKYLTTLKHLAAPAEGDAPDLFSSQPWQIKSCNSMLAGWAQMRHTWVLQAKYLVHYLGLVHPPAGFVEPVPQFWGALAELCEGTEKQFKRWDAFDIDPKAYAEDLRAFVKLVKDNGVWLKEDATDKFDRDDYRVLERGISLAHYLQLGLRDAVMAKDKKKALEDLYMTINDTADELEAGSYPHADRLQDCAEAFGENLGSLWSDLIKLVRRIETLSHKQLREVDFSKDEVKFIAQVGAALGGVMLYGGNSWLTPNDDAPRIVDISTNPQLGKHLHVGISRPRSLYVLYPWKGEKVLCRGVVMPYYEFTHKDRLDDADWMKLLDSKRRPAIPEWLEPIVVDKKLTSPKLKD